MGRFSSPYDHSLYCSTLEANVSPSAIYFSATEEEVKSSNEDPDDTVSLIDKEGYLGTIGVYHGLHCMVSMLNFFKGHNY
jgi:hypothetical protein